MRRLATLLMLSVLLLGLYSRTPTRDKEATVPHAEAAAAQTALPSATPTPTTATLVSTATPNLEATVEAAVAAALTALPTATPTKTPTATPSATATPDLEATVEAAVAAALTALPTATPTRTPTATPSATATPDLEATVEAAVAAALTALPTATPTKTPTATPDLEATVEAATALPTPTPSAAPSPTPTPSPEPEIPEPAPTPTPEPEASANPAPDTQPQVESAVGNLPFDYGIQVDPHGDAGANIGHIQALGFRWVKLQMPWKDVEPNPGDYQWGTWDNVIGAYSGAGIKVLLSIPKAPEWARPPGTDLSVEGPPADYLTFAHFLGQVAARYQGRVQAIEVWNEQNLWYEGGGAPMAPNEYVAMLSAAYHAIKAADPNMIVVSGAPTPAGDVGGLAIDDISYLNAMYAAGLKNVSDAIGAHPSGYNCPAGASWETVTDSTAINFRGTFDNRHHSWCYRGTMEGYRNVMVANGDGAKTIWPTEFGWAVSIKPHVGYEYAADNTPEEQAQWTVEAYQMGKQWGWVGTAFLWNLDYGITAAGTELAQWGLLQPGAPVPAYHALAAMPK